MAELDQLKGMAMKVGQILSYMDAGLPPETQSALEQLQAGVQPLPFSVVAAVVEAQLGPPGVGRFEAVEPEPVAAASVGQVHRARLGGETLALKVRYPGIRETFAADMEQLGRLARLASLATAVDGAAIVAELRDRLEEECDYRREAANQRAFAAAFAAVPGLRIPEVVSELSAEGVLTTRWSAGLPLLRWLSGGPPAELRSAVAEALVRFAWRGLFVHGAVHADPHPGNVLVEEDGTVVMLDFGCVRRFAAPRVEAERAVVRAVVHGDRRSFAAAVRASGTVGSRHFDFGEHWAMLRMLWAPCLGPRFRFARDHLAAARRFTGPTAKNSRAMAIPAETVWLLRQHWGLAAVLARMEAEGAFRLELETALAAPWAPLDTGP